MCIGLYIKGCTLRLVSILTMISVLHDQCPLCYSFARMPDASTKRMMAHQPPRIVSGQAIDEDARIEASVRPKRLDEYIGQKRVKENIQIAVQAARARDEPLAHPLLYPPPAPAHTPPPPSTPNHTTAP